MVVDYSKWETLANEEAKSEELERQRLRDERHAKYLKQQQEKWEKYKDEHGDHDHHQEHSCGCSMMDQERIERARKAKKDEMPIAERNLLKLEAIKATKTDGNRLFKEGNLDVAYAVYERGALICNGVYKMTDEQYDEVSRLELMLDLNMAAVRLRQEKWLDAISLCKQALDIDAKCSKAYYRMACAYVGMGDYDQALDVLSKGGHDAEFERKRQDILALKRKQEEKARKVMQAMKGVLVRKPGQDEAQPTQI
ncbi:unnamed protein product (mitochondrion) [Plasmodiophora brassicae]|uniref:Uncharacterized protein n=1 Tax=Plasmodiophora brassicae TaxID=37360 RepID=A0A0G4INE1_PLABS|nr:hypothetical protein PBRA_005289 [Plasmodiophora brassicae]SPQ95348.1 unnamed protein product [Plasmodiophora brassicae]